MKRPKAIHLLTVLLLTLPEILPTAGAAEGQGKAFHFARTFNPVLVVLLCAAIVYVGWWTMRREASFLSKGLYRTLIALRIVPFLLLIFLLLKPVTAYRTETTLRQHLILLIDESESMSIADKVLGRTQLESAARLLGIRSEQSAWPPDLDSSAIPTPQEERQFQNELGLSDAAIGKIKSTPRTTLAQRALLQNKGALLKRLRSEFHLSVYGFTDQLREIPADGETSPAAFLADLASTGTSTRLGTTLQRVVQDLRGQPVAGIIAVSDGRSVAGIPADDAAEVAGDAQIPVYAVPVGAGGSRDIAVTALIAESVVFMDDEFPVSAKISSRGYTNFTVPVVLECEGEEVDSQSIRLTGDEQLLTFRHKRSVEGTIAVKVRVRTQDAEETADNNVAETTIRVVDKKINVLMVEEIPRWDFRYLRNTLRRDPHVEVKCFLQQADSAVAESDAVYLRSLPATEKELFEYDLIILGGLRPRFLRQEQMEMIEKFVSKMGGGLIFMSVENVSPTLYAETPLEPLLPVRLTRDARPWLNPDRLVFHSSERRLVLTPEGRNHTLVAIDPEAERNERAWREFPPHYWVAEAGGLKPAAQVLVESVTGREGTGLPVVATQPYGLGRVLYIGIDTTWRWRYKVGDRYFVRFWSQAVQYLTLSRLLGQNKRLQIVADRESYEAGETVSLSVRALDASFQPRTVEEITITVTDQNGKKQEIRGYLEPDREGVYSAVYRIPYEGQFTVTVEDAGETGQLEFTARRAQLELREPEADWPTMARVAERSGGALIPLDHLDKLPELLGKKQQQLQEWHEQPLWNWWLFLLVFITLKTIELGLRKYKHLK